MHATLDDEAVQLHDTIVAELATLTNSTTEKANQDLENAYQKCKLGSNHYDSLNACLAKMRRVYIEAVLQHQKDFYTEDIKRHTEVAEHPAILEEITLSHTNFLASIDFDDGVREKVAEMNAYFVRFANEMMGQRIKVNKNPFSYSIFNRNTSLSENIFRRYSDH